MSLDEILEDTCTTDHGLHAWLKMKVFSRKGIYYMQLLSGPSYRPHADLT